ncbi:vomeronasal type-2 receptor 116 [Heterocephalus glaber]|uniref:Vomeronasal type-2 receptor 116 n=1 Tax=Heterocephalus glaber TaxID=10181 RepID=A0AAX6RSK0_HETGA|nr:vomeronasal type-2 receptor 116 [Heterocephalus glaber]
MEETEIVIVGMGIMIEFKLKNYQYVLALVFAIEEINNNPHFLPNISLGYEFHNVQHSEWRTLESSLTLLTGQDEVPNYTCRRESKSVAVLTGTTWETSIQTGTLLELYKFPQLTFGSFDPILSDNDQLPSLYQMAPKDTSLAIGMVSLMLYFSWTWVGLVIAECQKGLQFLSDLRAEMDRNRVCVAFVKMILNSYIQNESNRLTYDLWTRETSPANVVIIYFDTNTAHDAGFYTGKYLVTWRVWVTNSQWHPDIFGKNFIIDSFHGTLIFSLQHEEISGFKTFIQTATPSKYPEDIYFTIFWSMNFDCTLSNFDCTLRNCPANASLMYLPVSRFDPAMSDESYNIYNAVYAMAHALHEMLLQQVQMQPRKNGELKGFSPWQLHHFLKELQFTNPGGGQVNMNEQRKWDGEYDILNFWNLPEGLRLTAKVGLFSPHLPRSQQLSLNEDVIEWGTGITETPHSVCSESCHLGFRKSPQEGRAACCFYCSPCPENEISNETDLEQCVKCPDYQYANIQRTHCLQKSVTFLAFKDPLGKGLAGTALSLAILTAAVLGLFVKHRDTPIVKANNRALSYTLLISLIFCFLCSLLFIGRPNTATCILQQTTFGVVFAVAVSTVLAKTITVILAFKVTAPGRRMRQLLVSGAPNYIIPIGSLIQLTFCGVWMGTEPPYVDTDPHSEHGHIVIMCNKGSLTAFYCVLGYLGSLALVSFTVAFLARNLPDTFNEAKFLTFSMLVFCSVWVTFLPVYHSTKGKVMVAMEVFSILASSAGLLGCIFAPKCYIILLRPDRKSLHGFRDQTHSEKNKKIGLCLTKPVPPSLIEDSWLCLSISSAFKRTTLVSPQLWELGTSAYYPTVDLKNPPSAKFAASPKGDFYRESQATTQRLIFDSISTDVKLTFQDLLCINWPSLPGGLHCSAVLRSHYTDTDVHSEHGHIIILCNKGSLTAFCCVLGYLGSLALVSFTVDFLARNLPDTFNEAKFLTFSMLVFCSVWITFLPVYHSTKGKVMLAMRSSPSWPPVKGCWAASLPLSATSF